MNRITHYALRITHHYALCIVHCALCIILCLKANAQVGEYRRDVAIGFNVGYTMTQVSFQPEIKQNYKSDMSYGLTVRYNCEKYFKSLCGIQIEVNYANLGWKEKIETSNDTYSRDLHYIQIPFLARMGWGYERKGALFYAVAGPQIAFLFAHREHPGGEFSAETLALRPNEVTAQYGKPVDHPFDYGLTGGLGVELNTRHAGHYMIEGRYYMALGDIFNNRKKDDFGRSAFTYIYLKFGYLFDILKTKR